MVLKIFLCILFQTQLVHTAGFPGHCHYINPITNQGDRPFRAPVHSNRQNAHQTPNESDKERIFICMNDLRILSSTYQKSLSRKNAQIENIFEFYDECFTIIENSLLSMLSSPAISKDFMYLCFQTLTFAQDPRDFSDMDDVQSSEVLCSRITAQNCIAVIDSFCYFLTLTLQTLSNTDQKKLHSEFQKIIVPGTAQENIRHPEAFKTLFLDKIREIKCKFSDLANQIGVAFKEKDQIFPLECMHDVIFLKSIDQDAPVLYRRERVIFTCEKMRSQGALRREHSHFASSYAKDAITKYVYSQFYESGPVDPLNHGVCPFCYLHLVIPEICFFEPGH